MNIIALVRKHLKIYRRQKYAYDAGIGLFGRLYSSASMTDAQAMHIARNCNRYRNYAMGLVHCSVPKVRNIGISVW